MSMYDVLPSLVLLTNVGYMKTSDLERYHAAAVAKVKSGTLPCDIQKSWEFAASRYDRELRLRRSR